MPMSRDPYANYLMVNPLFESVVDIDADHRNPNLWQEYIVGEDMEKLMEVLCQSLCNEGPDARRSFWVHGTYGTGKSYAAIFVKHLLEEKPEVIDRFLANHQLLSPYRGRFMRVRRNGEFLVIWKTGCAGIRSGDMLLLEAEKAVREALIEKFGDKADLGTVSLTAAILNRLNDRMINWKNVLASTALGEDYPTLDMLREKVLEGDLQAIQNVAMVIRQNGWGLIDGLETFKAWIAEVIEANGLKKGGIFFIWDEFTEYVTRSDDHTILQQLSEFTKEKPFYMMFVVHRTENLRDAVGKEHYQAITHRFHEAEFHISAKASFDLIAGSFYPRPGMEQNWKDARADAIRDIRSELPNMDGLDDNISEMIEKLCPVHPMTIRLLSRVAESYAASQRTLFRFMKDLSVPDQGFVGYINKYGPMDQANWLTAEWLWDYFFTRESDFADKDTKVPEFIRHFEENKHMVVNDENTERVFKVAMLLLAVMSSTRGVYGTSYRTADGIAATVDCVVNCLAGTMTREMVEDKLKTLELDKLIKCEQHGNMVILQLPYRGEGDEFKARYDKNDKEFTRRRMFERDGVFSKKLEEFALDANDPMTRRIKVAACCAEKPSIDKRLEEIEKDLEQSPHKLGLLLVTVKDDVQATILHADLEKRAQESDERIIFALIREPLTDEKRELWLDRLTYQQLATEKGNTASAKTYENEKEEIVTTWVRVATSGGKITAWHGTQVYNNQYGMANLRKTIQIGVMQELFPYAPETFVVTNTAYKSCNDSAPLAGIARETKNSQLKSVLEGLRSAGILDIKDIRELTKRDDSKAAKAMAAVARLVENHMTGGKVVLADLWDELRHKPFGYYDTIACGVLLGYVFSFYKDSAFSWTDSAQSTHVLGESTLKTMVLNMLKGRMTTDYLSAGTVVFQNFRDYAKAIFALETVQVANETECWRNIREAITKSGSPLWALKYLEDESYINASFKETALRVVDALQRFVLEEHDREAIMSEVLNLMNGRGKVRAILQKAFQDKAVTARAFRRFLFDVSPELKAITERLNLQPELLNDKLHQVMQGAIYTWTEEQVKEKLAAVAREYTYLDVLNGVADLHCHDMGEARRELNNLFRHFRLAKDAVEKLKLDWFEALVILGNVEKEGIARQTAEEQVRDMEVLKSFGKDAMSALRDARPVLEQMLEASGLECTQEELERIYQGLRDMDYDTTLGQFERALKAERAKIDAVRHRSMLLGKWTTLTGEETVKSWCQARKAPIQWVVQGEAGKAIETVMDVQNGRRVMDQEVQRALQEMERLDAALLTDAGKIDAALLTTIGEEYRDIWSAQRDNILSQARQKCGADMSAWAIRELSIVRKLCKEIQVEKAKREKLAAAKKSVQSMAEGTLRQRITAFLDEHPEFSDGFME